jgi:hypothetical protein
VEAINELPKFNKLIVHFLKKMIAEFLEPENVATSRMSEDNLLSLLGPCFLRCPFEDPARQLDAIEKHKNFLRLLLTLEYVRCGVYCN